MTKGQLKYLLRIVRDGSNMSPPITVMRRRQQVQRPSQTFATVRRVSDQSQGLITTQDRGRTNLDQRQHCERMYSVQWYGPEAERCYLNWLVYLGSESCLQLEQKAQIALVQPSNAMFLDPEVFGEAEWEDRVAVTIAVRYIAVRQVSTDRITSIPVQLAGVGSELTFTVPDN